MPKHVVEYRDLCSGSPTHRTHLKSESREHALHRFVSSCEEDNGWWVERVASIPEDENGPVPEHKWRWLEVKMSVESLQNSGWG